MKSTHMIKKTTLIRNLNTLRDECDEVSHIAGKIIKFGPENFNPDDPKKTKNNVLLEKELGDVHHAIFLVVDSLGLDMNRIMQYSRDKKEKLKKYKEVNW